MRIGGSVDGKFFVDCFFCRWQRMEETKLNYNKSKPGTKLNLGHELRTTDSETKIVQKAERGL
jgi:hypothetical protein